MVARERRERQIGQCQRIDPHHLIDLRSRFDHAFDVDGIHCGAHLKTRLVGCCTTNTPSACALLIVTRQPSSSAISRESAATSFSPVSRLPPGCMKAEVPRLRTSRTRPSPSQIKAATTL